MVINLTVAWATPLDCVDLGARLEAYVETKAAISTFRICTQHAPTGSSLARLPAEVLGLVGAQVQEAVFNDRRRVWVQELRCCQDNCQPTDHSSAEKISKLKIRYFDRDYELSDDDIIGFDHRLRANGEGDIQHNVRIERYLEKIDEQFQVPRKDSRFMRCKKIFTQDFGLEILFTTLHDSVPNRFCDSEQEPYITTLAYLILPSVQAVVEAYSGPNMVSSLCSMVIDTSISQEPSYEQKNRFKKAMSALKLTLKVHEMQLTYLHSTPVRLPRPVIREHDEEAMRHWAQTPAERQAQALESTEWPKLMALVGGRD